MLVVAAMTVMVILRHADEKHPGELKFDSAAAEFVIRVDAPEGFTAVRPQNPLGHGCIGTPVCWVTELDPTVAIAAAGDALVRDGFVPEGPRGDWSVEKPCLSQGSTKVCNGYYKKQTSRISMTLMSELVDGRWQQAQLLLH